MTYSVTRMSVYRDIKFL